VIAILEYLGIYDDDQVKLYVVKIHANSREEADDKFIKYLKRTVYNGIILEACMYVIPLFAVDTLL
jgi:hypothetical protein